MRHLILIASYFKCMTLHQRATIPTQPVHDYTNTPQGQAPVGGESHITYIQLLMHIVTLGNFCQLSLCQLSLCVETRSVADGYPIA